MCNFRPFGKVFKVMQDFRTLAYVTEFGETLSKVELITKVELQSMEYDMVWLITQLISVLMTSLISRYILGELNNLM